MAQENQRMFEIGEGEVWTEFYEQCNDLLLEEKVARQENDGIKTSEIAKRVLQLCFDTQNYKTLMEMVVLISKRRG